MRRSGGSGYPETVNTLLWLLQLVLALAFAAFGLLMLTRPRETLLRTVPWVEDYPQTAVKAIGAFEVLGAIGIVVPAALGVATGIVPVAAIGLALVALGATVTHLLRSEQRAAIPPAALLAAAVLVAVGRLGPWPH